MTNQETAAGIVKALLEDTNADPAGFIDGLHGCGWTFTPLPTATDRTPLQMLAILVEMVEMYCPSLANSGGISIARAMVAGVEPPDDGDCALNVAMDIRRYLDRKDVTYSDTHPLTGVGIDGRVNLVDLARTVILPHLVGKN